MKRIHWILSFAGILLIAALWWVNSWGSETELQLTTQVKEGNFVSLVVSSGELMAKNSTKIRGPREVRQYRVNELKVQDLIPEGTIVQKGDYVGRFDPGSLNNVRKDVENEYAKTESQFEQAKLDTALELRAARDELKNLKFSLEERQIEVTYSEYEPPAVQRQAQINLEKAKRAYNNAIASYSLKRKQAVAKVREVGANLAIQRANLDKLDELMRQMTIMAPQDGMIIYARQWGGEKVKVGSTVSSWDPTVVELPDLSVMISKTFVNEVDISKVREGMPVEIGIDAFPDKRLKGVVEYVANVGESRNGMQGKAFEVNILLQESDEKIRPGMTTSNAIQVFEEEDAVYIPLEAVFNRDSVNFVIVKKGLGFENRQIVLGKENDNEVIVIEGLKPNETVFLNAPVGYEDKKIQLLNS